MLAANGGVEVEKKVIKRNRAKKTTAAEDEVEKAPAKSAKKAPAKPAKKAPTTRGKKKVVEEAEEDTNEDAEIEVDVAGHDADGDVPIDGGEDGDFAAPTNGRNITEDVPSIEPTSSPQNHKRKRTPKAPAKPNKRTKVAVQAV
jgi:hypothetical protein